MPISVATAILYNLYDSNGITDESQIREAISVYMVSKQMNRKCLFNIVRFYQQENERLRRQIDILMGHDVL